MEKRKEDHVTESHCVIMHRMHKKVWCLWDAQEGFGRGKKEEQKTFEADWHNRDGDSQSIGHGAEDLDV